MISASHNPFPDNGIKFIARGGYKLADAVEDEIESLLGKVDGRPTGSDVGRVVKGETVADQNYINHLVDSAATDLSGLRIVVDASNGAASVVGPAALRAAGAEVIVINASPDGLNINDSCGSTHPDSCRTMSRPSARTWAWPTTATPTAAWPWTPTDSSSTATRSWACSPSA